MTDPKCEDLIDARLEDRLECLKISDMTEDEARAAAEDLGIDTDDKDVYELQSDLRDAEMEDVLSIEKKTLITVLLSFGGPSDGFDFVFDSDGELDSCQYWYKDWFDGARRDVPMDQAQQLVDLYCIDPKA
jgi:hypothetical protein